MESIIIKRNHKKMVLNSLFLMLIPLIFSVVLLMDYANILFNIVLVFLYLNPILYLIRMSYLRSTILIINRNGIHDLGDSGLGLISWEDITGFGLDWYGKRRTIAIRIKDFEEYVKRCPVKQQKRINRLLFLGVNPLAIYADTAEIAIEKLMEILNASLEKANNSL